MSRLAADLGLTGPACLVSAGWQEWEQTRRPLPPGVRDLRLHQRAETLFDDDPTLRAEHRERQRDLMRCQTAYRIRLAHAMAGLDELRQVRARAGSDAHVWEPHEQETMRAIRTLDRHHLRNTRRIREAFHEHWNAASHDALGEQREQVAAIAAGCSTIFIAGGHVAVLLNRLRLFEMTEIFADKAIVAWGAGAMVLSEQVMLYDDRSPQGSRVPEVLEHGLSLAPRTVFLPDPVRRLDLDDAGALRTLAGRTAPRRCITIGDQAVLKMEAGGHVSARHVHRITPSGRLRQLA